jgi:hypothetical protein
VVCYSAAAEGKGHKEPEAFGWVKFRYTIKKASISPHPLFVATTPPGLALVKKTPVHFSRLQHIIAIKQTTVVEVV